MRMLLVLAAALALTVGANAATISGSSTKPTLRLAAKTPVTLRGLSFKARELVLITVRVDKTTAATRRVRATSTGSFAVTFAGISANDPCALDAVASGSRGSRAALKLPERMCPLPLQPGPATP